MRRWFCSSDVCVPRISLKPKEVVPKNFFTKFVSIVKAYFGRLQKEHGKSMNVITRRLPSKNMFRGESVNKGSDVYITVKITSSQIEC